MFSHYRHAYSTSGKHIWDHCCVEACTIGWSFSALTGFTRMAFLINSLGKCVHAHDSRQSTNIWATNVHNMLSKTYILLILCWSTRNIYAGNDFYNVARNNIQVSVSKLYDMSMNTIYHSKSSAQPVLSPARSPIQKRASRSATQADLTPDITSSQNTKKHTQQMLILVYPYRCFHCVSIGARYALKRFGPKRYNNIKKYVSNKLVFWWGRALVCIESVV